MAETANASTGPIAEFFSLRGRATGNYVLIVYLGLHFAAGLIGGLAELANLSREAVQTAIVALVIPTFVRRMHDNGRSGRWALVPTIGLVPRLGDIELPLSGPSDWAVLVLAPFFVWGLYLLAQAGNGDPGRYGPDPRVR